MGLDPAPFRHLHALDEAGLAALGAHRVGVDAKPSAPCRVTLEDAEIGEHVVLLGYVHQPADTPYRQQGPIFVRESGARFDRVGAIPPALAMRPLSLRGYDESGMMVAADLVDGGVAETLIASFFADPAVAYIHAHYARRGCFAARIDRA